MTHEIIDAGPDILTPNAGRKKIPVPIMELIVIRRSTGKFRVFFSSTINIILCRLIYKLLVQLNSGNDYIFKTEIFLRTMKSEKANFFQVHNFMELKL